MIGVRFVDRVAGTDPPYGLVTSAQLPLTACAARRCRLGDGHIYIAHGAPANRATDVIEEGPANTSTMATLVDDRCRSSAVPVRCAGHSQLLDLTVIRRCACGFGSVAVDARRLG